MGASSEDPGSDRGDNDALRQPPQRRKPPVTIDLAANPTGAEPEAAAQEHMPADEARPAFAPDDETPETPAGFESKDDRGLSAWKFDGVSLVPLAAAALAGAIVAVVIGIALETAGTVPTPAGREARMALAQGSQLERDIGALSASMRTSVSEQQAISARLAGLETIARDLITTTEQLRSLDGLTAATEARLEQLEQAVAGLQTTLRNGGGAAAGDDRVAALSSEVEKLSARITELSEAPPADQRTTAVARGMAFAGLRAAAERGEPFREELALLRLLGTDAAELAELEPSKNGVPSKSTLAASFNAIADAIVATSAPARADATFIERIWDQASSLVSIRPVGPIEGTTPEAVVSRMRAAVEKGDLAAALAERAALPDAGKSVSAAWAGDAEARIALDRTLSGLERAMETGAATQ